MPDVGEYDQEMLLAFEKEVLGIYVSGHPLEEYSDLWMKYMTHTTNDFAFDEETRTTKVVDNATAVVGGMIVDKKIKYTKNDKVMAFITLEDLVGNMEIIVFPKDYEKYGDLLREDAKVFVKGRVSIEEEKDGKMICEQVVDFEKAKEARGELFARPVRNYSGRYFGSDGGQYSAGQNNGGPYNTASNYGNSGGYHQNRQQIGAQNAQLNLSAGQMPDGIWIQFESAQAYEDMREVLYQNISDSDGTDAVVIYIKKPKAIKVLPPNLQVCANEQLKRRLSDVFGPENVRLKIKTNENV